MKNRSVVVIGLLLAVLRSMAAFGQEPIPVTKNYVVWAHEFLRTMYPDLNGKNYSLTLETAGRYDSPGIPLPPWILYVGEGPAYKITSYMLGYAQPPPPPPGASIPAPPKPPEPEGFRPGPQYPKQLLKASFTFDSHDRLDDFGASGSAIFVRERARIFGEQVYSHPEMTEEQVTAALKNAGAKYGPNDKQQFIDDLPITKLERFLGKLTVVSVGFQPLSEDRSDAGTWPWWRVTAQAKRRDGTVITYKLMFEQFEGDLTNINTGPDRY